MLCIAWTPPLQLDHDLIYAPGFPSPPNLDYLGYRTYIDESLPPESPYLYGLHPNAEIGFLTATSESMVRTVLEMQPRDSSAGAGTGTTREEKVLQVQLVSKCIGRKVLAAQLVTLAVVLTPNPNIFKRVFLSKNTTASNRIRARIIMRKLHTNF